LISVKSGILYVIDPVFSCDGGVLSAVFVLLQFFLATCSVIASFQESSYLYSDVRRIRICLRSTRAPRRGMAERQDCYALPFFSCPSRFSVKNRNFGVFSPGKEVTKLFLTDMAKPAA
jgi:hypothetical protein